STRPSTASTTRASRTGVRLIPRSSLSSFSTRRWLGRSTPERTSRRSRSWATCDNKTFSDPRPSPRPSSPELLSGRITPFLAATLLILIASSSIATENSTEKPDTVKSLDASFGHVVRGEISRDALPVGDLKHRFGAFEYRPHVGHGTFGLKTALTKAVSIEDRATGVRNVVDGVDNPTSVERRRVSL